MAGNSFSDQNTFYRKHGEGEKGEGRGGGRVKGGWEEKDAGGRDGEEGKESRGRGGE